MFGIICKHNNDATIIPSWHFSITKSMPKLSRAIIMPSMARKIQSSPRRKNTTSLTAAQCTGRNQRQHFILTVGTHVSFQLPYWCPIIHKHHAHKCSNSKRPTHVIYQLFQHHFRKKHATRLKVCASSDLEFQP